MNIINNELFNILFDLDITCAEFAQAVEELSKYKHYVWLKGKYGVYDTFLPIAKIIVEGVDIYIGVPINKSLNKYYINIGCGYCVFNEGAKCDINDITEYKFVAHGPVSPAMLDSVNVLIRQLQKKKHQQQQKVQK